MKTYTTSLEVSKRLKDAGYPQDESFFQYARMKDTHPFYKAFGKREWELSLIVSVPDKEMDYIASPTVGELGERFPEGYYTERMPNKLWKGFYGSGYNQLSSSDTEANARAEMWLYLNDKEKL